MHNGVAVFASGSFSANLGIYASSVHNTFHLVTLEEVDSHVTGKIQTWVYRHGEGWAAAHQLRSGFPASTGFDSRLSVATVLSALVQIAANNSGKQVFEIEELMTAAPQLYNLPPDAFTDLQGGLCSHPQEKADHGNVAKNGLKTRRRQLHGGSIPPPGTIKNTNILRGIRSLPRSLVRCILGGFRSALR